MTDDIDNDGTTLHESGGVVQPTDAQIEQLLGKQVWFDRKDVKRLLTLAVPQAPLQAEPVPVVASEPVMERAKRMYAEHPTYRGTRPMTWYEAPKVVRREWLDKAAAAPTNDPVATPQAEPALAEQALDGKDWVDELPYGEGMPAMKAAIRAALASQSTPPPESAGQIAATIDPLQGAADWLVRALGSCGTIEIAWRLSIGNNRASRLYEAAILAANSKAPPPESAGLMSEIERLNAIINTPHTDDFLRAVSIEAEHQRQRWGEVGDAGKTPADWFWLLGYLGGKAVAAFGRSDPDKGLHHIISSAAALKNWHMRETGQHTAMRPGIDGEAALAANRTAQPDGGSKA